jgi:hypothetical protein
MSHEEAVEAVRSGNVEAVRKIDGQFSLVSVDGKTIRMARSIGRPIHYFIAKVPAGPQLVIAERIDVIYEYFKKECPFHCLMCDLWKNTTDISVPAGNGAMDLLMEKNYFVQPDIRSLETVLEYGIRLNAGRVFADVWDLDIFSGCKKCSDKRTNR